ncbi:MAG TPA: glycosyltransferase [Candidatus Eremiobacteraceae bacterium]|nr:glycosyltransferase [Candidatus Eremiobacteraceae bacterium]
MVEPLSIASVIVVYNGGKVLPRLLNALKQQTRRVDEIVVVNNASSDDTANLLSTEYPEVTVLNQPENGGVGGGFAAGLAYAALTRKCDWVWLFDQDSTPARDGLERLLSGLQYLEGNAQSTAMLAPVCRDPETGVTCPGLSWRGGRLCAAAGDPSQHINLTDSVISSGSLIRREAIEAVGLPRADFFMDFVDHEYCFRLRRHGFKIAVIQDSLLDHVLGDPSQLKIFGRTKYWTDHLPWREYYMTRNEVFTIWRYYSKRRIKGFVIYRLARHALDVLLFGKRKVACFRMMYRGFLDGRAGRLGIRFLPENAKDHFSSRETAKADALGGERLEGKGSA